MRKLLEAEERLAQAEAIGQADVMVMALKRQSR